MPDHYLDWPQADSRTSQRSLSPRFFGKYRGVVVSNDDPQDLGRLQVRVPAVLGDAQAVWALPCVPYAGAGVGFYVLPEPGTNLWVEFEAGDPSSAIWAGCFWGSGELPHGDGASVKIWKTAMGTIRIDDNAGEILIETSGGAKITLKSDAVTEAGGGKHTVGAAGVVSEKGAGKVEVLDAAVKVNGTGLVVT